MNYSIFFSNKDAKLGKINDANELFLHEYELCLTFVDKNSFLYCSLYIHNRKILKGMIISNGDIFKGVIEFEHNTWPAIFIKRKAFTPCIQALLIEELFLPH